MVFFVAYFLLYLELINMHAGLILDTHCVKSKSMPLLIFFGIFILQNFYMCMLFKFKFAWCFILKFFLNLKNVPFYNHNAHVPCFSKIFLCLWLRNYSIYWMKRSEISSWSGNCAPTDRRAQLYILYSFLIIWRCNICFTRDLLLNFK